MGFGAGPFESVQTMGEGEGEVEGGRANIKSEKVPPSAHPGYTQMDGIKHCFFPKGGGWKRVSALYFLNK